MQLASGVVRPTQTSQGSQSFVQLGTWVQGRHSVSSSSVSRVQPASEPSQTKAPLPAGSSQHPKQSQPFGTSGPQVSEHIGACSSKTSSQEAVIPGIEALGSYSQRESPLGGKSGATDHGSQV
jgi:hypothetical protein